MNKKRYLIIGGAGQVGFSIVLRLLKEGKDNMVIHGLTKNEVLARKSELQEKVRKNKLKFNIRNIKFAWGNLFCPLDLKDIEDKKLILNGQYRKKMINFLLSSNSESYFFRLVNKYKPNVVINSVNFATYIGYQMKTRKRMNDYLKLANDKNNKIKLYEEILEKNLLSRGDAYVLKWYTDLYSILKFNSIKYIEISTTGFGGMGFNLLWTHGESNQLSASDELISKAMIAGMSHQLSWNLWNTPGIDIHIIVPSALIAWNRIASQPISRGGNKLKKVFNIPISRLSHNKSLLKLMDKNKTLISNENVVELGIDSGENSFFGAEEFKAITALGQMEMVTKEEVAQAVLNSLNNNNKNNILFHLNKASLAPSRISIKDRKKAIVILRKATKKRKSIAFGNLGPYITKMLFELFLFSKILKRLDDIQNITATKLLKKLEEVLSDNNFRSYLLSLGIPILLRDGKSCYFPPNPIFPKIDKDNDFIINNRNIDKWATLGWIDLRINNIKKWKKRLKLVIDDVNSALLGNKFISANSPSINIKKSIDIGEVLACILSLEGGGRKQH